MAMTPSEPMVTIRVQSEDFDAGREVALLAEGRRDVGGIVSFTGYCRDEGGTLAALELEHYPGMAEEELSRLAETALERWPLFGITIVHRYGRIAPGAQIVLVACSSAHRRAAFEAADFLMDWLKSRAPFWKREIGAEGPRGWVAAKDADEAALTRW